MQHIPISSDELAEVRRQALRTLDPDNPNQYITCDEYTRDSVIVHLCHLLDIDEDGTIPQTQYKINPLKSVIEQEIKWCQENAGVSNRGKDYEEGFIKGLEQVKNYFLILPQVELEIPTIPNEQLQDVLQAVVNKVKADDTATSIELELMLKRSMTYDEREVKESELEAAKEVAAEQEKVYREKINWYLRQIAQ